MIQSLDKGASGESPADNPHEHIIQLRNALATAKNISARIREKYGLSAPECDVLYAIGQKPGRHLANLVLVHTLHRDTPRTLEKKGLIERTSSPKGGNAFIHNLSAHGEVLYKSILEDEERGRPRTSEQESGQISMSPGLIFQFRLVQKNIQDLHNHIRTTVGYGADGCSLVLALNDSPRATRAELARITNLSPYQIETYMKMLEKSFEGHDGQGAFVARHPSSNNSLTTFELTKEGQTFCDRLKAVK